MHHQEWVGAGRWMDGSGDHHEHNCQHQGDSRDPERITEELIAYDTNQSTTEVSAEKCAWLGRLCIG